MDEQKRAMAAAILNKINRSRRRRRRRQFTYSFLLQLFPQVSHTQGYIPLFPFAITFR